MHVEVGPRGATAEVRRSTRGCEEHLVRTPRCSFVWVRGQARALGITDDFSLRIGWLFDEKWFVDSDPYSTGKGGVNTVTDSCH